jgi:hypothetical protein
VLSSLSSVESYFEFFSTRSDQEYQVRNATRAFLLGLCFEHLILTLG